MFLDFERMDYSELFQFSLCIFELYSRGIILSYFYFYYSILNNLMYTYMYVSSVYYFKATMNHKIHFHFESHRISLLSLV